MNVGSLFSGIGGIDLGLERAGMRVVWQCESNPYARAVLRKHWPDIPCYDDVRWLRATDVVPVDLICGGFPCQDISAAGLGAGLGGERSGLWFHFARIIGETRPQYAIIENTPPFRRWVPVVRRHLHSIGYASLPIQLRAADFGAPYKRARIFVVASRKGFGWREGWARGSAGLPQGPKPARLFEQPQTSEWWCDEPGLARLVHGVPADVDRLRCLGNAVVPQVAEYIGRCILMASAANASKTPPEALSDSAAQGEEK